jgi:hypothetical protein
MMTHDTWSKPCPLSRRRLGLVGILLGYGAGFHGIRNLTLLLVLFGHHPWESYEL